MKDTIIIHCSATKITQDVPVEMIDRWHQDRGFRRPIQSEALKYIGYNWYVRKDGSVWKGRDEGEAGAHTTGWNTRGIGICYEGGLDSKGKAADTRTPQQKETINNLVNEICRRWPITSVIGHRDTSPDKNGNGVIEPHEWLKECPCYDVDPEYKSFIKPETIRP